MVEVVGVRFKEVGKIYYFDPAGYEINKGDSVIIETARGMEYGKAITDIKEVEEEEIVPPLKSVMRVANEEDEAKFAENQEKTKEFFEVCKEKIEVHKLDMKLIEVEYTFDRNKILFYFTAEGRVDFRELVKDLAAQFRTRIELRQVGVRDEAKMVGGLGICGRELCCKAFLGGFQPVSIKMAKEQSLSLNPTKISGCCGRLMCCLKYEQDAYEELHKRVPKVGAIVETPDGKGKVVDVNLLKETVKVKLDNDDEADLCFVKASQLKVLKNVRGKNDSNYDEELEKLED